MSSRALKIVEEEFEDHAYHLVRGNWDSPPAMLDQLRKQITKRIEEECVELHPSVDSEDSVVEPSDCPNCLLAGGRCEQHRLDIPEAPRRLEEGD